MDGGHRTYEPIGLASSLIGTNDCRITTPGLHATVIQTKVVASAAIATSIIGFCIFDFDIGHIAVAFISGIIGLGMIRGT